MGPEFWVSIIGNAVTIGAVVGMMKRTQDFHAERFVEHADRIEKLDKDKLDVEHHKVEVQRIDGWITNVQHRVSNVDQRVHSLETKR